ncbi:beta-ketoacyl synthase N-terminal-like domain-containing protein [Klebsiella michiganensis]|uniref:Beta-ketoacyl synthase n=1 Tax=Klebsiella michiganensis TaxID=1134687 RepID=A0A6P1V7D2_9ENTR|nr:beta-ketoacyl synthase N-terminal-like domain-containing protein [Klebsiella michiganensis]MXJ81461.1 beta-ketoacyl synthase [Klebsiella michiganensis]QHS49559.1 beta-ketoacyl synthase [Klebsiella michiganensis]
MGRKSIISGYSVHLPFADDSSQLITNLKQGKRVKTSPWFRSDDEAIKCGLRGNINAAIMEHSNDSIPQLLYSLIDEALKQSMLDEVCLREDNVRVYITGIGPRVDAKDYRSFATYNDSEDLALTPSITNLSAKNMSQDIISTLLAKKYRLKYLPPNLNCTSNSGLAAIHLASQAIERGGIELAIIINISQIKSQDIWFLSTQSMLDTDIVQPFGINSKGVIFAEGYSVMLLESNSHRLARNLVEGVSIKTAYKQINASRSNDVHWQITCILKLVSKLLNEMRVKIEDLCAFIPHGNGTAFSDNIEAKAIAILAGENTLPVLAYKGQIGYTATGSGLVDLIIGYHSVSCHELIKSVINEPVIDDIARHLLTGLGVMKHHKNHLLKTGLGVDGSIIAVLLTNNARGAS